MVQPPCARAPALIDAESCAGIQKALRTCDEQLVGDEGRASRSEVRRHGRDDRTPLCTNKLALAGGVGGSACSGHTAMADALGGARPAVWGARVIASGRERDERYGDVVVNERASHRPECHDRRAPDVRVVSVDDQPAFLEVARALIEVTAGFQAVGEARSGREALDLVAAAEPDLVLLDVRMAGLDGIETARLLHADHPALIVVLMSADEPEAIKLVARSCGAMALVRKQDLNPRLLRRLWAAHRHSPSPPAHSEGP